MILDTHYGKRSWWSGDIRTLCGGNLPAGTRYVGGKATCQECLRLKQAGKGTGYR